MSDSHTLITSKFLEHCSPDRAYEWLWSRRRTQEQRKENNSLMYELWGDQKVLENVLFQRNNSLIDLGLAQFGETPEVLKEIIARGNAAIRCAILSSQFLFGDPLISYGHDSVIDLAEVVSRGDQAELITLAHNEHLPNDFYTNLINREGYFAQLNEDNYKLMLSCLGYGNRLAIPYPHASPYDGYGEFCYDKVHEAAWQLAATVPATQEWAHVMSALLQKSRLPIGFKNIEKIIERWYIDPPKKVDDNYNDFGNGFYLRSRLADILKADERLLNSPDLALRLSFYRRFEPMIFNNWPEFLDKDGKEFLESAMWNVNLWKSREERNKLYDVARDYEARKDKNSSTEWKLWGDTYNVREEYFKKEHPEWFLKEYNEVDYENPDETSTDTVTTLSRIERLLKFSKAEAFYRKQDEEKKDRIRLRIEDNSDEWAKISKKRRFNMWWLAEPILSEPPKNLTGLQKLIRTWGMIFRILFIASIGLGGWFIMHPKDIINIPFAQLTLHILIINMIFLVLIYGCWTWICHLPHRRKDDPHSRDPYKAWAKASVYLCGFGILAALIIWGWLSNK